MPLNARNQRTFHRTLFAGILESVTLLKRDDNQRQGTVRSIRLHQCRKSLQTKTGETIQADISSDHRTIWHLPRVELDRVGVAYLNPADRIVDDSGKYWQPESTTEITVKLFEVHVDLVCLRIDPPPAV